MQYARIQDGIVAEIIEPMLVAGIEVPIAERFHPDFVARLVAIPAGATVNAGDAYSGGKFGPPPAAPAPSTADLIASYEAALQVQLDDGAQAWGYDSIISAASYATSTNAQFKAEADAMIEWRDDSWTWAAAQLAAVQAGTQSQPATPAAFVALAPAQPTRPKAS